MTASSDPQVRSTATRRLAYVDTLRGFAALWVFLLHIHGYWLDNVRPPTLTVDGLLVRVMGFGGAGVDIFIVLSGFCLTLPLTRGGTMRSLDPRRFFRRRAYRLLPAYYAAVILVMALELVPALQERLVAEPLTGFDVITHLTLTFPLFGETLGSVNGSLWSISLEATLYLGFPLLLLIHRRWGMRGALLTTFAVALIWAAFTLWWVAQPHPLGFLPDPGKLFPARWFQFALGMWAATLVTSPSRARATKAWIALPVAVAVGATGYAAGWGVVSALGFGVVAVCLLVALAQVRSAVFETGPLRWLTALGVISYSFYLLDQPVLLLTSGLADPAQWGIVGTAAIALAVAGTATVLLAAVFYHFIEKPFLVRGSMRSVVREDAPRPVRR
ncbi:peptidoglycan/LPS O-acetylase OafA/YrhL [Humibacillus xanthopallidus]|uniref:Peptidoglycan/LPS O-acetylase OafA/YrhL n=1 Tax=Humibacillus xanthopallidus TaxID=412689 RepID=A0A543PXH2_9MICO|nr:acyltransferase [Humibacillus xanthopallidus]TQN48775.1 peptidoglycan/LPS O-acetylase OafA/YrhL [Humibacillus xanthopallidus]